MFILSEKVKSALMGALATVVCLGFVLVCLEIYFPKAVPIIYNYYHNDLPMNQCIASNDTSAPVPKRYLLSDEKVTFFEAWRRCQSRGLRLATINSEAEGQLIAAAINASSSEGDWYIGGTDLGHEGVFVWISTNMPVGHGTGYYNFFPGEPNNEGYMERCLEIIRGAGVSWNDVPCSIEQEYICETVN
ncbi:perlucin-like [Anopheles darlingi]|uniref:perlucin-like n=1 Tax=Anopheles darlingi TaxID=43151 RepID=UPI0021004B19|nr:perlucin-like [Anopheles darlingi]